LGDILRSRSRYRDIVVCGLVLACFASGCGSNREADSATGGATDGGGGSASDAAEDPNCPLPEPAPVVCFDEAGPRPSLSRVAHCPRMAREIARLSGPMYGVRALGDMMYWRSEAAIMRQKGTSRPETLITDATIGGFEVDDLGVYFVTNGLDGPRDLLRMNLDGTELMTLSTDIGHWELAIDQDRIYFDTDDHKLVATSKTRGGSIEAIAGPSSVSLMKGYALGLIDATHIYWTEHAPDYTLKRVAKGTSSVETLADQLPGRAILLKGDALLLSHSNYILEISKAGGCPQLLAAPSSSIDWVAADERAVYWNSIDGSGDLLLKRTTRTGGVTIEVIAPGVLAGTGTNLLLTPTQVIVATDTGSSAPKILAIDRR
jgi:hypothetical protein